MALKRVLLSSPGGKSGLFANEDKELGVAESLCLAAVLWNIFKVVCIKGCPLMLRGC